MRQQSLTFADEQDLRWEDLSARTRRKLLELLAELMEQAGEKKEIPNERQDHA